MNSAKLIKGHRRNFWLLNIGQMAERLAFASVLIQLPIYISQKDDPQSLGWEQTTKGFIFFCWALAQNLTPLFAGALSDKIGVRLMLTLASGFAAISYFMLGLSASFPIFLFSAIILGISLGCFKPAISASIARNIDPEGSRNKWAVTSMLINIAVFAAMPFSLYFKTISYTYVFMASSIIMTANFLYFAFFLNPDNSTYQPEKLSLREITASLRSGGLLSFIIIMSGFTIIYMQFYETLPNFIVDWVSTTKAASALHLPDFMIKLTNKGSEIAFEWLYNINTVMIILLVTAVNFIFRGFSHSTTLSFGTALVTIGFGAAILSQSGGMLITGFIVYTLGEMICIPVYLDYISNKAPGARKGLYMSYLNISWAIGLGFGGLLGGAAYRYFGEKSHLALHYLQEHGHSVTKITSSNAFSQLQSVTGLNPADASVLLWNNYHPYLAFLPFIIIGIISSLLLFLRRK